MLPRGKVDRSQGDMAGLPVNEAVGGVTWVESPCCHPVCDGWLSSPFPWQWPILLPTCHAACPSWNTALKRRCKDLVLLHSQKSICFGKLKSNINTQGWCFVIPPLVSNLFSKLWAGKRRVYCKSSFLEGKNTVTSFSVIFATCPNFCLSCLAQFSTFCQNKFTG